MKGDGLSRSRQWQRGLLLGRSNVGSLAATPRTGYGRLCEVATGRLVAVHLPSQMSGAAAPPSGSELTGRSLPTIELGVPAEGTSWTQWFTPIDTASAW